MTAGSVTTWFESPARLAGWARGRPKCMHDDRVAMALSHSSPLGQAVLHRVHL